MASRNCRTWARVVLGKPTLADQTWNSWRNGVYSSVNADEMSISVISMSSMRVSLPQWSLRSIKLYLILSSVVTMMLSP